MDSSTSRPILSQVQIKLYRKEEGGKERRKEIRKEGRKEKHVSFPTIKSKPSASNLFYFLLSAKKK